MDISPAYRVLRTAAIQRQMPAMARKPDIFKQYVNAVLQEEWGKSRQTSDVHLWMNDEDSLVRVEFTMVNSSPITTKLAIADMIELQREISNILGA
jgi:hypothetical protein